MKVHRNDPCPCGSGKKYKKCCQAAETGPPADLLWSQLREASQALTPKILRFVEESCNPHTVFLAEVEFFLGAPAEEEDGSPIHAEAFWPWFFFDWLPAVDVWRERPADRRRLSIAARFLGARGDRLPELEWRWIEEELRQPWSLYEVSGVRKGAGFILTDVFRADRHEVSERTASSLLCAGDLVYAKLLTFDHLTLVSSLGQVPLEPDAKIPFLDFAEQIRPKGGFTTGTLNRYAKAIRGLYLSLADRKINPVLPRLTNTDGEPLVLHELVFEIASADEAVNRLADLDITIPKKEVLAQAERDAAGRITRAEIGWSKKGNALHREWDNTTLGRIVIDGQKLTVEANSRQRAERIRAEIERRLAGSVKHLRTVISNPEKMLEEARKRPPKAPRKADEDFQSLPEVQAKLREMMEAHYESWIDMKIPALGGETPRKAVRHPLGRAKVEALIATMERQPPASSGDPYDFGRLRTRLGLEPPARPSRTPRE